MLTTLVFPLLLTSATLSNIGEPSSALREAIFPPRFELTVAGVINSSLAHRDVRFRVTLGKKFSVRPSFLGGESAELSGVLRLAEDGGYRLELVINGVRVNGRQERDSFREYVPVGEEKLFCHGWVRWYRVNLTRAK
jgi:hypothetical protein